MSTGCDELKSLVVAPKEPNCEPKPSSDENPYLYAIDHLSDASAIYSKVNSDFIGARQVALAQLTDDVEHLSAQKNIVIDNTSMVRIIITYLDPQLIQYVLLNHYLNDPGLIPLAATSVSASDFETKLKEKLDGFAKRNEVLFLVTITSPNYREQAYNSDVLTVKIPTMAMKLVNGSNRTFTPDHVEYILNTTIDITHGPVSGIVGYPTYMIDQGECIWLIDEWTNSLTLGLENVELGETIQGPHYWKIPYRSLIMPDDNNLTPTFDPTMTAPVKKLDAPPTPHWTPGAQDDPTDKPKYWNEMARYIWSYLIAETHQ